MPGLADAGHHAGDQIGAELDRRSTVTTSSWVRPPFARPIWSSASKSGSANVSGTIVAVGVVAGAVATVAGVVRDGRRGGGRRGDRGHHGCPGGLRSTGPRRGRRRPRRTRGTTRRPSSPSCVLPGTVLLCPHQKPRYQPTGRFRDLGNWIVQLLEPSGHRRGLLLPWPGWTSSPSTATRGSSRRTVSRTSWVITSSGSDRGSSTVSRTSSAWTRRGSGVDGLTEVVRRRPGHRTPPAGRGR